MTQGNSPTGPSILWHDYETFGANPARDRPCQFAAIRTDLELNIVGEPETFYCQLANDYLPAPEAILITGITPQLANNKGMPETEFMGKINDLFSQKDTCVAGYNSIRFDDEVSRYGFYRNFIDPYAREWRNGNSRWDIIDLVRACYALRPEGIVWPTREDGRVSFKLEQLTRANNLGHDKAHDAMSDVYATIAMAKLIKEKQPKLYQYYFDLRRKQKVSAQLDVLNQKPVLHVSSRFSAAQGCTALIAPLAHHPINKNAIICVNLDMDVSVLLELSVEQIKQRMYTPRQDLAEDELPIGVKLIHINKCPFVANVKTLSADNASRINLNKDFAREQYAKLKAHPEIRSKLIALYDEESHPMSMDPDLMLYSGGFFSAADKAKMEIIRQTRPQNLAALSLDFDDKRLVEMFFRYRGRNYPQTLDHDESQRWREFCKGRLSDADYWFNLENLLQESVDFPDKQKLLSALCHYLRSL